MKIKHALTFITISIVFGFSLEVLAQSKVGTTAGNFLQIGLGARAVSLGEAASANASDLSGVYWNPSLAAQNSGHQAYFSHVQWFANIDLNYGAAMLDFNEMGKFGIMFSSLNTDQMEVTTELFPEGTGAVFTAQDLMIGLFYSRALTDRFNIGGAIKYINSTIWNMSASAIALDFGLTYKTPFEPLTLGMSLSNFGSEMKMAGSDLAIRFDPDLTVGGNNDGVPAFQNTRSWDLPVIFRVGLAYNVVHTDEHSLLLLGDVLYPSSQENLINTGIEYGFLGRYFIRGGYRQLLIDDAEGGLTLGAGVNVYNIIVDYAYSDRGNLDYVQYFSVGIKF